jgi:hypothetical protein
MAEKKYQQYVLTDFREDRNLKNVMSPQAYFRGASQIPGAGMNMGWQVLTGPMLLEKKPHSHDEDEYLVFLGWKLPNVFEFDADIDFYLGEEQEHYEINKATVIYIPKGMVHCPLNFKRIGIPILFHAILLAPKFTKEMDGKQFVFEGPEMTSKKPSQKGDLE